MDTSWSVKVKDEVGFPAFALLNRVTGQALRHGRAEKERVCNFSQSQFVFYLLLRNYSGV